jgi:hypothetical protein
VELKEYINGNLGIVGAYDFPWKCREIGVIFFDGRQQHLSLTERNMLILYLLQTFSSDMSHLLQVVCGGLVI